MNQPSPHQSQNPSNPPDFSEIMAPSFEDDGGTSTTSSLGAPPTHGLPMGVHPPHAPHHAPAMPESTLYGPVMPTPRLQRGNRSATPAPRTPQSRKQSTLAKKNQAGMSAPQPPTMDTARPLPSPPATESAPPVLEDISQERRWFPGLDFSRPSSPAMSSPETLVEKSLEAPPVVSDHSTTASSSEPATMTIPAMYQDLSDVPSTLEPENQAGPVDPAEPIEPAEEPFIEPVYEPESEPTPEPEPSIESLSESFSQVYAEYFSEPSPEHDEPTVSEAPPEPSWTEYIPLSESEPAPQPLFNSLEPSMAMGLEYTPEPEELFVGQSIPFQGKGMTAPPIATAFEEHLLDEGRPEEPAPPTTLPVEEAPSLEPFPSNKAPEDEHEDEEEPSDSHGNDAPEDQDDHGSNDATDGGNNGDSEAHEDGGEDSDEEGEDTEEVLETTTESVLNLGVTHRTSPDSPIERPLMELVSLRKATAVSTALHVLFPVALIALVLAVVMVFNIPFWDWFKQPKSEDITFVLTQPTDAPRPDSATHWGEHNQQAGEVDEESDRGEGEEAGGSGTPDPMEPSEASEATEAETAPPQEPTPEIPPKDTKPVIDDGMQPAVDTPSPSNSKAPNSLADKPPAPPSSSPTAQGPANSGLREHEKGDGELPGVNAYGEPDFGKFMEVLERRIQRQWYPPRGSDSLKAELLLTIGRDGTLIKAEVVESSGSEKFDDSAIQAAEQGSPYMALPPTFQGESVEVEYSFDYTIKGNPFSKKAKSDRGSR